MSAETINPLSGLTTFELLTSVSAIEAQVWATTADLQAYGLLRAELLRRRNAPFTPAAGA